jgi:ammonium transporter Rh
MKIGPFYIGRVEITMFISMIILVLFFGLFVVYADGVSASSSRAGEAETDVSIEEHYPMYMDVHVMIFVGFGFLMVFLKSYSWSAVGMNYLIAAWAMMWCILTGAFWHNVCHEYLEPNQPFKKFGIDMKNFIFLAEFGAGAVLITYGALLGKCNLF